MEDLTGKCVIITGASSGIGVATAKLLSEHGARLVLAARRTDRLADLAQSLPGEAVWQQTDVARRDQVQALAALALERFGQIDVLINNAGILPVSRLSEGLVDDWDRMIDVNLKGVLYGINAVLGPMLERGSGHIVNVSSVAALTINKVSAVYGATKQAVRIIGESLRQDVGEKIRVTTITPGGVNTELAATIPGEAQRAMIADALRTRSLQPEDVAGAIVNALRQPPGVALNEIVIRSVLSP